MKNSFARWSIFAALAILFLLRYDFWQWSDARLVLGLPIGLLYHAVFCIAASLLLTALVTWAWPEMETSDRDKAPGRDEASE